MSNQPLFMPYRMGDLDLPNRIVMAPLTRMRAQSHDHVPTALQAEYYAQRASAGLIIAEATAISPEGFGWADTPGLWTTEQVRGWRRVTDAVHAVGGRIIAQLWHTGAISHPELLDGAQPVSASNVDPGQISVTPTGRKPTVAPRADETGDSSYGCRFRAHRAERDGSRLRWRPDPRELSLSDLAVLEHHHQPA
jgi:N-ethylmaleimide reductase